MKKLLTIFILFVSTHCFSQSTMFKITNSQNQTVFKITDTDAHYNAGVALSGLGASTFYYFVNKPLLASFVGAIFGTTVGVLKEKVWDGAMGNGTESLSDMAFTGAGSFVVVLHFNICINSNRPREDKKSNPFQ